MELREKKMAYLKASREIDSLRADIKLVKSISYSPVVSHSGGTGGRTESLIDRIVDMETECKKQMEDYYKLAAEIRREINSLHCKEIYKDILYMRYVDGMGLMSVADELGFVYEYVKRLHGQALRIFAQEHGYEEKKLPKVTDISKKL